jgi:7-cyano-7-deazaguanine synthase
MQEMHEMDSVEWDRNSKHSTKLEEEEKSKAIVMLSGGLDSTTTIYIALDEQFDVYPVSFNYKQRHSIELQFAAKMLEKLDKMRGLDLKNRWKVFNLDFSQIQASALVNLSLEVPKNREEEEMGKDIPISYVPLRNTIFLSYAAAYAESIGALHIFAGMNCQDYSGYPDCRPEYISQVEKAITMGSRYVDDTTKKFCIHTPLMNLNKGQIIQKGVMLGVDYNLTWSCYDPQISNGRIVPCQECDSCKLRLKGFEDAQF